MSFENRHIFNGKINNKGLNDFRKLDFKKNNIDDRLKAVNAILESGGQEFFAEYFDNHYKVELNQSDELSEKNNVCKSLENMANYILGSAEVRAERNEGRQQYRFFMDKTEFNNLTKKEDSLDGRVNRAGSKFDNANSDNDDKVINFLLKTGGNKKKSKAQVIFAKDLNEDSYCGEVLRQYQAAVDFIDTELENIKLDKETKFKGQRYKLTKAKKDYTYDMIYCKNALKGVFGEKLKNQLIESTEPSWDKFDWHETTHIKELLFLQYDFEPQDDLSYLILDLENIIKILKQTSFTPNETKVITFIRQGYTVNEIKDELNLSQPRITQLTTNIVKKIQEYTLDNFKREA